jgi:hypothetical protein
VLNEIGIEKDSPEYNRLSEISRQFGPEFQRRAQKPTDEDREQKLTGTELYGKVEAEYVEKMQQIIEPRQFKRLREIFIQRHGIDVILADEFATELKLSDQQRESLRTIKKEFDDDNLKLQRERRKLRESNESTDEIDKKINDLEPPLLAKYETVLTPEQRNRFAELKGAPFEWKDGPPPRPKVTRRPGMPTGVNIARLTGFALRESVLEELEIKPDSELAAEIRKLMEAQRSEFIERSTKARENPDRTVPYDPFQLNEELQQKYHPLLEKLLAPEKYARLRQVEWQFRGCKNLYEDPELSKSLELTDDQKKKLQELRLAHSQKSRQLLNPPGGRIVGTPISDEVTAKSYELLAEWETKSREVLDESQREKFQKLTGKPFDVEKLRVGPQRN